MTTAVHTSALRGGRLRPAHRTSRAASVPQDRAGARRRWVAIGVLALLLVAVCSFSIWTALATERAAARAAISTQRADDIRALRIALNQQRSILGSRSTVGTAQARDRFAVASGEVDAATVELGRVGLAGASARLLRSHRSASTIALRAFAGGPRARAAATDADRRFSVLLATLTGLYGVHHNATLIAVDDLQRLSAMNSRLTPAVFVLGVAFAVLVASVARRYLSLLRDERRQAVHDSLHDALTGLPNRALLADRFGQALRDGQRRNVRSGLLLIDLDRFKEINDTFGHHYGDEVLRQVGPRVRDALRLNDTVARLGGDEFAVLLPDVSDLAAALELAARLRTSLEAPFRVEGIDLDVEASVGVVLSGQHGEDEATLLQRADIAMYVAKTQNLGVFAYDPDADENSPTRLALLGDLRRALERRELELHYQPKVSVDSGEVVGAEALIRWRHPTRGMVYPDSFIPVAEHTGLIGPLTLYVLDEALTQAAVWLRAGHPLPVSVNLSARNLLDDRLPAQIAEHLHRHGVPASLLELEVTESAIMTDPVRAQRLLHQLAELGISISIDDFGAGYTSLSQLRNLPVRELKIDRSFVMTMSEDTSNALIVRSVVELGHNLGLTIVAEGVEDVHALNSLNNFGCDIAQGFHISRPVAGKDFDAFWRAHAEALADAVPHIAVPHIALSTMALADAGEPGI